MEIFTLFERDWVYRLVEIAVEAKIKHSLQQYSISKEIILIIHSYLFQERREFLAKWTF